MPDTLTPEQLAQALTPEQLAQAKVQLGLDTESPAPSLEAGVDPSHDAESTAVDEQEDVKDGAPFYCPGCGRPANFMKECTGSPEQPHKPIEVVSTDELKGAGHIDNRPDKIGSDQYEEWASNHTAAPNTDVIT